MKAKQVPHTPKEPTTPFKNLNIPTKKAATAPQDLLTPKNLLLESGHAPGDPDLRRRIALKAYELYQERGCQDGHDCEDWLEAEKRVLSDTSPPRARGHA